MAVRHPSQIYEAILEGMLLFFILNKIIKRKNYKIGDCSILFLIFYGIFRIIGEFFREPDLHLGYFFNILSMGSILSFLMIISGIMLWNFKKKK